MDIQSKEIYTAVKQTIAAYKVDYYEYCRSVNEQGAHIKTNNYTRFIEQDHNPVRLVEEYMFIQNKVSRKSACDRKIIVAIVEAAIELAIKNIQEEAERKAKLEEALSEHKDIVVDNVSKSKVRKTKVKAEPIDEAVRVVNKDREV